MSDTPRQIFREKIETYFGSGRCFVHAKGRVGFYAGLRAMNLPLRAKILMPGYTCVVVPSAVQFAEFEPIYVDIDPDTYNLNPDLLEQIDTEKVSAVVVQHTYGIPCGMARIQAWADAEEVSVIEDCCHTFGVRVEGRLCGTFGRFAFMSGQWNKPFSTGLGGILLVNDPSLADEVSQLLDNEARQVGFLSNLFLSAQIRAFETLVTPRTTARITRFYRVLNRLGLVVGSSSEGELRGDMPEKYLSTMAPCQIAKGLRELGRIEENIRHRKRLTAFYHGRLADLGFGPLRMDVEELPLLRYPVRVTNKNAVLEAAEKSAVEIGSWFEIPLHPAETRMADFGYRSGMCPEAERASEQVINLPTHLKVDEKTAERTLRFLKEVGRPV